MNKKCAIDIVEIITFYLKENGYDGLYNLDADCGCLIGDIAPCGEINKHDCYAGYKSMCDGDCHEKGGWHVQNIKG